MKLNLRAHKSKSYRGRLPHHSLQLTYILLLPSPPYTSLTAATHPFTPHLSLLLTLPPRERITLHRQLLLTYCID